MFTTAPTPNIIAKRLAESMDLEFARAVTARLGPYWCLNDLRGRVSMREERDDQWRSNGVRSTFFLDGEALAAVTFDSGRLHDGEIRAEWQIEHFKPLRPDPSCPECKGRATHCGGALCGFGWFQP